jgi:hypothetical protein
MKLHLLLLALLCNLSNGFMATLKGPLNEDICTGEEYADFTHCAMLGAAADPTLPMFAEFDEQASVNRGGDGRKLSCAGCPTSGAPRGTYCFTMCGSGRRRRLSEKGTDTPNLRRVQQDNVATFKDGGYTGNDETKGIAQDIIKCMGDDHPCLGPMTLTVTL